MNFRYIIILFFSSLFIFSCDDDNEIDYTIDPSTDAQIYSFTLNATHKKEGDSISRAQDSLRFLEFAKTKFAIDQSQGVIYNPDSLPYGFKMHKAQMTLTYNATYGISKLEVLHPDSVNTFEWDGKDSIDFSKNTIELKTYAPSSDTKTYTVKLLVHQIDPDIIVWQNKGNLPGSVDRQRVLMIGDVFYNFTYYAGSYSLYKSDKQNISWSVNAVSGLDSDVVTTSIHYLNGRFFAVSNNGNSYVSPDGLSWAPAGNGKYLKAIYGVVPAKQTAQDELLVVLKEGSNYSLATTKDMMAFVPVNSVGLPPMNSLPVSEFSSFTNYNRNGLSNFLVVTGGLNQEAEVASTEDDKDKGRLSSTLLIQYTSSGISVTQSAKNTIFKGEGLTSFLYDTGKLYVIADDKFYISDTWGQKWIAADKQVLDPSPTGRKARQAITENGNIWLFGGMSSTDSSVYYNDVWKGRLNSVK